MSLSDLQKLFLRYFNYHPSFRAKEFFISLTQALSLAQYLDFDMEIMSELLPVGVYAIKTALNDNLSEKN